MIDKISVFLNINENRNKVGELACVNKKIYFQYDNEFLKKGVNISPISLPFNNQIQLNGNNLFGVFDDSLPDGWGRLLIDRYCKKNRILDVNKLDYLSFVGKNGFGALEYEPYNDLERNYNFENLNLDQLASESMQILNDTTYFADELLKLNGSSGGTRPKITVKLNNKNVISQTGEDYIIKFRTSIDDKDIGLKEYVYSVIAKKSGIDMSKTILLPSKKCSGYFATKRFDRIDNKKLHLHSAAGLLNMDFRTSFIDYVDLLKLTKILTKSDDEVLKMFRLMCFNVITNNKDDHAKNFSFIMDDKNQWKLGPAYDLTYSNGINGEHTTTVNGKGKDIKDIDLINVGKMFDIDQGNSRNIIQLIRDNFNEFRDNNFQIK